MRFGEGRWDLAVGVMMWGFVPRFMEAKAGGTRVFGVLNIQCGGLIPFFGYMCRFTNDEKVVWKDT